MQAAGRLGCPCLLSLPGRSAACPALAALNQPRHSPLLRPQPQRVLSVFLGHNRLSGHAFPPAWLRVNTTMDVESLGLDSNARLGGTLPSQLPWRSLREM